MGRDKARRLTGSRHFRQRLVLATLTSTAITIDDIRSGGAAPGLRPHEVSLLHLLHKISDHHSVDLNETGTKLRYKPGVIVGGRDLEHECGVHRGIGYFLEPLILLGLFARAPLSIRLKGITNDTKDPSVDTFRMVTLHMLKQFGVPLEGLELKIESRGAPPLGGGEVFLRVPNINSTLKAANWVDEGMVKRIRGVTFSTRVSPQIENRIIYAARGIFNRFIPDVHIFTDHRSGSAGGRSAGYGVSVVAETTTGCLISADATVSYPNVDEMNEESESSELTSPEDLGVQVASMLLEEVAQGGVVDSTHQGLLFILCALSPPDVSKVRVGQLTPYAIETLRNIRDFLDVKFIIKPDPNSNTVTLKCVGAGVKNLARKTS
ncbi:probable RNA 3'-terminal phosphate cyclase-like protein [Oryza brachyantha]|uniref:probable RNA 3'-terminal phosphate cyclase-like protein n=1 Tax=Oryza brachyantha TaxID=4533 RepID=UPI001ADB984C|nr:probable RNA 3'-terminal phosphate cyclase-like protein [Oryza brachyantha]